MGIVKRRPLLTGLAVLMMIGYLLPAQAQSVLERMRRKAEQTAQDKAVQKTGEAVDKGIDKAINKAIGGSNKDQAGTPATGAQTGNPEDPKKQLSYYAKYDF